MSPPPCRTSRTSPAFWLPSAADRSPATASPPATLRPPKCQSLSANCAAPIRASSGPLIPRDRRLSCPASARRCRGSRRDVLLIIDQFAVGQRDEPLRVLTGEGLL